MAPLLILLDRPVPTILAIDYRADNSQSGNRSQSTADTAVPLPLTTHAVIGAALLLLRTTESAFTSVTGMNDDGLLDFAYSVQDHRREAYAWIMTLLCTFDTHYYALSALLAPE